MIFRRLLAGPPTEMPAAQFAANSRPAETAVTDSEPGRTPPGDAYIFTILAALEENPGVLDRNTPGLPLPPES